MKSSEQVKKSKPAIALIAMILAVSMTTIDQTIVALSAGKIQTNLVISHLALTWSINAYILATAAFFILGGKLADTFGHKRMVSLGIIGFAVFSLLCGLTPQGAIAAPWLITSRILQGVSAAIMFPAALGVVYNQFGTKSRGKASALFFGISGAMTAIGPFLGGILTQWTWRAIFWVNIPIALIALSIVASQMIVTQHKRQPIDWRGAALIAGSMAFIIASLQQAGTEGWSNPLIWIGIIVGLGLAVQFIRHERTTSYPLLRVAAFKDRAFSSSVLATLFASIAFVPIFFFLSVYGQVSLHLDVNATGLLLLKFFWGFISTAYWGGIVFDKLGARYTYLIGGLLGAIGFAWLAMSVGDIAHGGQFFGPQFWPTFIAGAGIGFMFSPASVDVTNRSSDDAYGEAASITQTAKNFGGALGLALLATLLTSSFSNNLTKSFTQLGATKADAQSVVRTVNGSQSESPKQEKELPKAVSEQFNHAVQQGYADSSKVVFYGMSGAMVVVLMLGVIYPKRQSLSQQ